MSTEGIKRGYVAAPVMFNKLITELFKPFDPERDEPLEVHPEAFRFEPQGERLHLAIAPMPKRFARIVVPDSGQDNINALGVVFAVGPYVGGGNAPHPGAPMLEAPSDLLYRQVMIKKFCGTPLSLCPLHNSGYYDTLVAISERDILAIDFPEKRYDYGRPSGEWMNLLGWQLDGIPEEFVDPSGVATGLVK